MSSVKALKIYDYLTSKDKGGVSLLTIARETGTSTSEIKNIVNKFPKSFVQVGASPQYTVNSFSSVKDHERYITSEIKKQKMVWVGFSLCIFTALLSAVITINGL